MVLHVRLRRHQHNRTRKAATTNRSAKASTADHGSSRQ
jgi:hypothetical protein